MYMNGSLTEVDAAELAHRCRKLEEAIARMEYRLDILTRESENAQGALSNRLDAVEKAALPPWMQARARERR